MKNKHQFDCKNALIRNMRPTNAISCCKYAGSVSGTSVFSMLLIHFDKEIAFRLRGVTAMCATHQFLQWIVTTYGDIPRSCQPQKPLLNVTEMISASISLPTEVSQTGSEAGQAGTSRYGPVQDKAGTGRYGEICAAGALSRYVPEMKRTYLAHAHIYICLYIHIYIHIYII